MMQLMSKGKITFISALKLTLAGYISVNFNVLKKLTTGLYLLLNLIYICIMICDSRQKQCLEF